MAKQIEAQIREADKSGQKTPFKIIKEFLVRRITMFMTGLATTRYSGL